MSGTKRVGDHAALERARVQPDERDRPYRVSGLVQLQFGPRIRRNCVTRQTLRCAAAFPGAKRSVAPLALPALPSTCGPVPRAAAVVFGCGAVRPIPVGLSKGVTPPQVPGASRLKPPASGPPGFARQPARGSARACRSGWSSHRGGRAVLARSGCRTRPRGDESRTSGAACGGWPASRCRPDGRRPSHVLEHGLVEMVPAAPAGVAVGQRRVCDERSRLGNYHAPASTRVGEGYTTALWFHKSRFGYTRRGGPR
jgi:hypothetical protein